MPKTAIAHALRARIPIRLGQVVMTRGVCDLVARGLNILPYIARHRSGDWGELCDEDKRLNDQDAKHLDEGARVLSSYDLPPRWDVKKLWITTQLVEEDLLATTVMLPSEY